MKEFGNRLKMLRLSRGFTQAQLAEQLGISPSAVGMYEQENRLPNGDMLLKLSRFFLVSVDYLLGAQPMPKSVEEILQNIKNTVSVSQGLTFNGELLDGEDIRKLFDAMLVAANVLLGEKTRRNIPAAEPSESTKSE